MVFLPGGSCDKGAVEIGVVQGPQHVNGAVVAETDALFEWRVGHHHGGPGPSSCKPFLPQGVDLGGGVGGSVERFDFYDKARKAYAVIVTGETRFYGCFILKKGVIPPKA